MNREIKFRIYNGIEMVYDVIVGKIGAFYVNPDNGGIDLNDSSCITPFNTKYPYNIPIMQYTGLKDKDGKDIYEGDILENDNDVKYIVVWMEQLGGFYLSIPNSQRGKEIISCAASKVANEPMLLFKEAVIGNIYENPELVNNNKEVV